MAVSHGITHEIMYHLAVGPGSSSRSFDRIHSLNLSTAYLWLFLVVYDEPQEVYFWTYTVVVL